MWYILATLLTRDMSKRQATVVGSSNTVGQPAKLPHEQG
jgi:5,10-methylene-tetrahydrofolate dehydrogenase/methenyl tetrahydrofolate cyclohydrolase